MKTPASCASLAVLAATAFSCSFSSAVARVGEAQIDIERRIVQPNVGKVFFKPKEKDKEGKEKDKDKEAQQAEKERLREEKEAPFFDVRKYFPAENKEVIYWKSAIAGRIDLENGWKVHVFYVGGRSALEAYRRMGEPLNEFEVRALLAINRGNSSWKKIPKDPDADRKAADKPAAFNTNGIGFDYETEDGSLRAKVKGDWIMIFSTRMDGYVIEQQKLAKAQHDAETEKLKGQQQGKAPESIQGF